MQPWWGCRRNSRVYARAGVIVYIGLWGNARAARYRREIASFGHRDLHMQFRRGLINIDEFCHARGDFLAYDESRGLPHGFLGVGLANVVRVEHILAVKYDVFPFDGADMLQETDVDIFAFRNAHFQNVRLFDGTVEPSASLEQGALDELRKDRSDRDLHVPFLSGDPGVHGHVLHPELKLDWQPPKFHYLAQGQANWDSPDVPRRRVPVSQDITRVTEAPALTEEDRSDGLQVHLVRVRPTVLAADRPPLLGKHADEELLCEVAHHRGRAELPLALPSEPRGRSREDGGRSRSEDPVARVRRRQQLHQSQIAQPGGPLEVARGRLVGDNVVEWHHRPRDQVPILGQAHWQHGLEIPVVVPLAIVQLEIVKLIRDGDR